MAPTAVVRRVLALGAAALVLAVPAPAAARSGTWGVAQVPYEAGVVCETGVVTSPLVRWGFGDPEPDFLLRAVTSNGVRDSAQLPVAGTPNRVSTAIQPGQYGFASADDIATYAALLHNYGGPSAAAAAQALLQRSDPGRVPRCGPSGTAAELLASAQAQAGPYQVSLSPERRTVTLGRANALSVQVTGRSGAGAPHVPVTLDASAAVFDGGSSTTHVVTDANGRATAEFTAPDGTSDRRLDIEASASVSVGLQAVTVGTQFGGPGPYAPVAYADAPQTATARTSVSLDLTADPHITTSLPAAVVTDRAVHLGARITGMRGHTGEAHITAFGPQPLDGTSLCAGVATGGASGDPAYDSGDIDIDSDDQVAANTWTPLKAGCYVVRSHVVTTNAVPEARAEGHTLVVTVLDTASTLSTPGALVARGALPAKLHLDRSYGLSGTARVRVLGPKQAADNDCGALNWSHAPVAATGIGPVHGDGDYTVRTDAVTDPGCYELDGSVALDVPGAGTVRVPIEVAPDSRIAYVLDPTLRLTGDETSTVSPHPVGAHVEVAGTFGQAAHLRVAMVHALGGTFGCGRVDYSHGTREGVGPAVAVSGDGTYAVRSGPTPRKGCYTLVPIIVMDANRSIRAAGTPGAEGSTILAAAEVGGRDERAARAGGGSAPFGMDVWTSVLVYGGIALLICGVLLRLAFAEKEERSRPSPGLDTLLYDPGPEAGRRSRLARGGRHGEDRD